MSGTLVAYVALMLRALHPYCKGIGLISVVGPIVDDKFSSTVPGLNFDTDFHLPLALEIILHIANPDDSIA